MARYEITAEMLAGLPRPIPYPTPTAQPFWDALDRDELALQHCAACGAWSAKTTAVGRWATVKVWTVPTGSTVSHARSSLMHSVQRRRG